MTRSDCGVFLCFFLATCAAAFAAQGRALTAARSQPATAEIRLGESVAPLYGPWKFTVGDSPIDLRTGQLLWAEPDFDDSRWESVDLTPTEGAVNPINGQSGYVPGWTAKGHPRYWGYAWYRIRVQLQAPQGEQLAVMGPADVDDAYQVFDNGVLAGHFGDFTNDRPVAYGTQPKMFLLAHDETEQDGIGKDRAGQGRTSPSKSTLVLAFRLWMEPQSLINGPDSGGMHSAPVLDETGAVAAIYQIRWLELIRAYAAAAALALLFGLLAVIAFSLILFDRSDRVYLWMGALFLLISVFNALAVIGSWTELLSVPMNNLLLDGLLTPLIYAAWVMVFWVWFRQRRLSWLPRLTAGLTLLLMISSVLGDEVFFGFMPHAFAGHFVTVSLGLRILFFVLVLWVVVDGIHGQGIEGWLLLPVALLWGINAFSVQLSVLHIRMFWFPFGVQIYLGTFASLLVAIDIAFLLLRRLLQSVKRQRQMTLDVMQAQEVQQVILPDARMALPGLTIESEYRPAREVGGDFFQIVPHTSDGSILIVAGDVTGKGLKAGMLVALLVGAIRTEEKHSNDPTGMLRSLNQRLLGRGEAQATCLALRIAADGAATLANAGHMAPYLNGEPLAMEGALPLGIMEDAEFSVMRFQLKGDDRLVLLSDGVAEATDADGKLFGFERVHELLRTATTAAEVAGAAQAFGQEDDISVIAVTRAAVPEPEARPALP